MFYSFLFLFHKLECHFYFNIMIKYSNAIYVRTLLVNTAKENNTTQYLIYREVDDVFSKGTVCGIKIKFLTTMLVGEEVVLTEHKQFKLKETKH